MSKDSALSPGPFQRRRPRQAPISCKVLARRARAGSDSGQVMDERSRQIHPYADTPSTNGGRTAPGSLAAGLYSGDEGKVNLYNGQMLTKNSHNSGIFTVRYRGMTL